MFEFSIVVDKKDAELCFLIWNKIEKIMENYKGVSISNTNDNITITLFIQKKNKTFSLALLRDVIAECIVVYFKSKFLASHLSIPTSNESCKTALLKALSVFDKRADVELVKSQIPLSKRVHLSSLFEFKLSWIKKRWLEICEILQNNVDYLLFSNSFDELTKYLISTTDAELDAVFVYIGEEQIIIRDKVGNNLAAPIPTNDENSDIIAISELISLAPKNVYLKFDQAKNRELSNKISGLFCDKIRF